MSSRKFKV